jgi:hypothetical protein
MLKHNQQFKNRRNFFMKSLELEKVSREYLEDLRNNAGTNGFNFKAYVTAIANNQARKSHESWCVKKREAGYTFGEKVDDEKKTTNLLVDFDELPEEYKQANIDNAVATVELMMASGVFAGYPLDEAGKEDMIKSMAKSLHDKWVITKMNQGYVYGEKRNDDPEKGQRTHRDMLPFETLMKVYPEDVEYDCDTAAGMINDMIASGMILVAA